jgi:hypothetical protein
MIEIRQQYSVTMYYVFIGLPFLEDENRLPVIAPVPRDVIENRKKYDQERRHMILNIDMQQWEVGIQLFVIC